MQQLRQRNTISMIAERGEKVIGFMVYELQKERFVVVRFAVAADCRLQGVGRAMTEKLISRLSPNRRTRIVADVPESALGSLLFGKRCGFVATKCLRDEEAIRMVYRLTPEEEFQDEPGKNRIAGML